MKSIHFISGLPRSGSTLLAAILKQNPAISSGITSPVLPLVTTLVQQMSRAEPAEFFSDERRASILRALLEGAYAHIEHVVDTSRGWCSHLPLIGQLYPGARVICCVRNLGWIINSIERVTRENPLRASSLFGFRADMDVYARAQLLTRENGIVGRPYAALKEAWFSDQVDRLIILDYDTLVTDPHRVISELYTRCGWSAFEHDFDHIEHDQSPYDARLGTPGLHRISGPVRRVTGKLLIPPDLFDRYADSAFWTNPAWNLRGADIIAPAAPRLAVSA